MRIMRLRTCTAMMALIATAGNETDANPEHTAEPTGAAPDLIPRRVEVLNDWRLRNTTDQPIPMKSAKAGRNEPCPCGPGKKYKKCCGLN